MKTNIKTSWGQIYNGIRIVGNVKKGGFSIQLMTDTAFSNTYSFSTLKDAKAFADSAWTKEWVELNTI